MFAITSSNPGSTPFMRGEYPCALSPTANGTVRHCSAFPDGGQSGQNVYGQLISEEPIPEELRPQIARQLELLVEGQLPEFLTWVHDYGTHGAVLIHQPDEIWDHRWSSATPMNAGGWYVVVPLWTTEASPSDLSAELIIEVDGTCRIHGVHVL
jgi:hypothetical protein